MNNKFWIVWNPEGGPPRFRHDTKKSAEEEADRLAINYPGHTFIVMEAVCSKKKIQPVETVVFKDNDDPFGD